MGGILVAGTTSDAGRSVVTTGLCRALARRGVQVAPFKAQNMSNSSMVCTGGARGPRTALLTEVARLTGLVWQPSGVSFAVARDRRLELLADLVEQHLDLDALHALAVRGAPDLPVIGPVIGR